MKLKKKTFKQYTGKVYDLSVSSKDRSYIVSKKVVHNSAAGSLICYLINITLVDPIEYNLLFERFLSKARLGVDEVPTLTLGEEVQVDVGIEILAEDGKKIILMPEAEVPVLRQGRVVVVRADELLEGDTIID